MRKIFPSLIREGGYWQNNVELWDFIHSTLESERKQLEREIEMLIVEELLIANKEGQPTSRLASLAVKIKNLFHKKQTKRVSI